MGARQPRRIRGDERGMILLVAIPMVTLLVGCLWYVVSVGDAILYRERLQDAADAAAYESAVLHARGMNALAMLNVLMALLTSVIAAIRATELLGLAALALSPEAGPVLDAAHQVDLQTSARIGQAIAIVNQIEKGVAAATPVLAAVTAAVDTTRLHGSSEGARDVLSVSYALLPGQVDAALAPDARHGWRLAPRRQRVPAPAPRLGALLSRDAGSGTMPSLPVEEDLHAAQCGRAARFGARNVGTLASAVVRREPLVRAVHAFAGDSPAGSLPSALDSLLCDDGTEALSAPTRACRVAGGGKGDAQCEAWLHAHGEGRDGIAPASQRPARVWSEAENGNVMLQVWSLAAGDPLRSQRLNERMLRMVAPGRAPRLTTDATAYAQAEYYFACDAQRRTWRDCADGALWSLGWTARMRRLWWPGSALGRAATRKSGLARALASADALIESGLTDLGVRGARSATLRVSTRQLFEDHTDGPGPLVH